MTRRIALIGNPNSGKTLLFNQLTGQHARVGNWPGVTVERREASVGEDAWIDLPGCYHLLPLSHHEPIDEAITRDYVLKDTPDLLINVLDISQLERHLYLTLQLIELGVPMIVVCNKMDLVSFGEDRLQALSQVLGCPVWGVQATDPSSLCRLQTPWQYAKVPNEAIVPLADCAALVADLRQTLQAHEPQVNRLTALILEYGASHALAPKCTLIKAHCGASWPYEIVRAEQRYQWIHAWMKRLALHQDSAPTRARLDQILLHRFFALPCFFMVMALLFFVTIQGAGILGQWITLLGEQGLIDTLLVPMVHSGWVKAFWLEGALKGAVLTLSFVPSLWALFFGLHALEESGYMARVAFMMDRFMQYLSLPGRAFIAMMVGFGCNVPALMATRVLGSYRERLLTALMIPFMSCSARLAVFAVFAHVFFPRTAFLLVLGLYVLGIGAAVITGLVARLLCVSADTSPLVMELPPYQCPRWSSVVRTASRSVASFLTRAGMVIVPLAACLSWAGHWGEGGVYVADLAHSLLATWSKSLTPYFSPIGIASDNWPAVVALLTGVWAKEVMLSALGVLYQTQAAMPVMSLWEAMRAVPMDMFHMTSVTPLTVQGLVAHFHHSTEALAYLVFVSLYVPCMATVATFKRELGLRWSVLSVIWSLLLAYSLACLAMHGVAMMSLILMAMLFVLAWAVAWKSRGCVV